MNALLSLDGIELWHLASWTMVHFLWLGALVAAAAATCRFFLRRTSPNIRYALMVAWLLALAALPFGTAAWLYKKSPPSKRGVEGGIAVAVAPVAAAPQQTANTTPPIIELHNSSSNTTSAELTAPSSPTSNQSLSTATTLRARSATGNPKSEIENATAAFSTPVATLESCIPYLPWLWLIGTPLTFVLLLTGVVGTRRLSRASQPITDGPIAALLSQLTESLRIGQRVTVAVCDRIAAPVLIGILRPIILLPPAALTGWSPDEIEMVLLHELAHVRRWDNLLNLLQRFVESLLFFHPAVWLISSWVRNDREACCDAVVVTRTNRPQAYAEMLVALAAQMPRSVLFHPAASSAMAAGPLRSRIRRILQLEDDPMLVSGKSLTLMLGSLIFLASLAATFLSETSHAEPSDLQLEQTADSSHSAKESAPSADATPEITAEFPHQVRFEKGASKFSDGDKITIEEVRGTAKSFEPGNKYWIKGTYTLQSHDHAQISAFTTAKAAVDGTGPIQSEQTKRIDRGDGEFTLILPMTYRGWPHVSFYPADGGDGFGGLYFGTGDSVLKEWWGSAKAKSESSTDADVASRAWQILGIRLEPMTEKERSAAKALKGYELKIVGVAAPASLAEAGARGPFVLHNLRSPHSHGVNKTFRDVADVLDKLNDNDPVDITYYGLGGDDLKHLNFVVNARVAPLSGNQASNSSSKFPSLEDQKLADLAWKRLSLELEPIGNDDLKLVKALGYDGGVKVVSGSAGVQGLNERIQPADILVGLHVWPTMSMKDVATVLDRDDLSDLNPLKFYVVRHEQTGPPSAENPSKFTFRDVVHTGRVSAKIDGGFGGRASSSRSSSTSTQAAPSGRYQAPSSTPTAAPPPLDPFAPTPTVVPQSSSINPPLGRELGAERRPVVAESTPPAKSLSEQPYFLTFYYLNKETQLTRDQREQTASELRKKFPIGISFVPLSEGHEKDAVLPNGQKIEHLPSCVIYYNGKVVHELRGPQTTQQLVDAVTQVKNNSNDTTSQNQSQPNKSLLRYDGKTFDEWRNAWKTELSTEKRLEGIKALAAFGRAGFGKEATAAILDVAGEYDFTVMDSSDEGKLKQIVVDELAPLSISQSLTQTLAKYWVPDLAARLDKEPKKWKMLAQWLFPRLQTDDGQALAILQSVAASGDPQISGAALSALVYSSGARLDDKTRKLIDDALQSKDPTIVRSTLQLLVYAPQPRGGSGRGFSRGDLQASPPQLLLRYQPAMLPMLMFHADMDVRRQTREMLKYLDEQDARQVMDQLLAVLKDKSRERDHIEAVRALAALGSRGYVAMKELGVIAELQKLCKNTRDNKMFVATLAALSQAAGPSDIQFGNNDIKELAKLFEGSTEEELKALSDRIEKERGSFPDDFNKELGLIFNQPDPNNAGGGGGGFF